MNFYIKNFLQREDGVETIEFIGVLAVGAGLVAAIANIASNVSSQVKRTKGSISSSIDSALKQA